MCRSAGRILHRILWVSATDIGCPLTRPPPSLRRPPYRAVGASYQCCSAHIVRAIPCAEDVRLLSSVANGGATVLFLPAEPGPTRKPERGPTRIPNQGPTRKPKQGPTGSYPESYPVNLRMDLRRFSPRNPPRDLPGIWRTSRGTLPRTPRKTNRTRTLQHTILRTWQEMNIPSN